MDTIMILANALQKAAGINMEISRLDIQYNTKTESYSARLWLVHNTSGVTFKYDIHEDGSVERLLKA